MFLPKLSNQEIGCFHSKSPAARADGDRSNASSTERGPGQVDDIGRELAELKIKQDSLRQTLRQVGEQLLTLAQGSGGPASIAGRESG